MFFSGNIGAWSSLLPEKNCDASVVWFKQYCLWLMAYTHKNHEYFFENTQYPVTFPAHATKYLRLSLPPPLSYYNGDRSY